MKKITGLLFLVFISITASAQTKNTETITVKTSIVCDHCMRCGSCGVRIKDAIYAVDGVKKVVVSPKENTITISYKPSLTNAMALRKVITESGFDADDQKAQPAAYEKLDGCCKAK